MPRFFFLSSPSNLLPSPSLSPHSPDTSDDLLECPTIRHKLAPRCVRQRVKVGRTLPDRGRPGHCTHYPSPPLPYPSISPSPFSLHNNFGGGFADDGDRWSVELFGANLFDTDYMQVAFSTPLQAGSYNAFLGAPRTYGVTLRAGF